MSKGKYFDNSKKILRDDAKAQDETKYFNNLMRYAVTNRIAPVCFADVPTEENDKQIKGKSKLTPLSKKLIAGTAVAALITLGAIGYATTKKSDTVVIDNPIYHNNTTTQEVFAPVQGAIDGPAALMKVAIYLNDSEKSAIFGSADEFNKAIDGNPDNGEYQNGTPEYIAPEHNATAAGKNGSFNYTVLTNAQEIAKRAELSNALGKKLVDLSISTRGEPLEYTGARQSPSYFAEISDLVELQSEIDLATNTFTCDYLNFEDSADMDKALLIFNSIPALADLAQRSNMGNVSKALFVDTPDDIPGTQNGGGGMVVSYDNQERIDAIYILDKNDTAKYISIRNSGGTRSASLDTPENIEKTQKEITSEKYVNKTAQKRKASLEKHMHKKSMKEMLGKGFSEVYHDAKLKLLIGYDNDGSIKEVRHTISGKSIRL